MMPCTKHNLGGLGQKGGLASHLEAHSGQAGFGLLHGDGRCHSDYEEMRPRYQINKGVQKRND